MAGLPKFLRSRFRIIALLITCYVVFTRYYDSDTSGPRAPAVGRYDREHTFKSDGIPVFEEDRRKRKAIVEAFKHSWRAYERDAFGDDEFHPLSHKGSNFTSHSIGFMLIDSHDTLMLMVEDGDLELQAMYERSYDWIANRLDFANAGEVNMFETTIRVLGGLLSAYHLAPSPAAATVYLRRAADLADRLLPAFDTPTGIPLSNANLATKQGRGDLGNGGAASTAEATTLQLEFKYLSYLTGDDTYWTAATKAMRAVKNALPENGPALVPIFISPQTGRFVSSDIRLGSRADSYYEYLLKQYLQTNLTEPVYRKMYDAAMDSVHQLLFKRTPITNKLYTAELLAPRSYGDMDFAGISKWTVSPKQDHLVCFLGGSLMLGATEGRTDVPPNFRHIRHDMDRRHWASGKELIETCITTHRTPTGLSPEIAVFYDTPRQDQVNKRGREWYIKGGDSDYPLLDARYILRPEIVESLFIAFRLTGDSLYRSYGWLIFQAIEKHCKVPEDKGGGFVSIRNVDRAEGEKGWEDKMETFFLAETLKYLYLLFSDASVLPLKDYVFNTEAHPLPVFTPARSLLDLVKV